MFLAQFARPCDGGSEDAEGASMQKRVWRKMSAASRAIAPAIAWFSASQMAQSVPPKPCETCCVGNAGSGQRVGWFENSALAPRGLRAQRPA